ncbi:MAG TPA: hypothetical protein VFS05_05630 [Gemmatimonadaceae bacterium]|nr:hypothetical protein [Gemmatimonadaceae bacterium]
MSHASSPTPRREFLGTLATATVALAGAACAGQVAAAGAQSASPAPPAPPLNDDWASRLTAKHKAVFDAPAIADGTIVANAFVYLMSYHAVYGVPDSDMQAVLVIRHAAIPMAVDDAFWAKYELGKAEKVKDPATGKWALRNPFLESDPRVKDVPPGFSLSALRQRGAILLGCGLAAKRLAARVAARTKQDPGAVETELRAHLIPGLELAHSGIFAVMRAQEAGCTYIRSA